DAHARLKALEWDRSFYGAEAGRSTIGVVGLGKVGSRVATRLRACESELLVYDPYIAEAGAKDLGARLTDYETLLRQSDVVTFHVPLTPETENMMAARELALTKRGVRIVNCARGGIVNEGDLLAALDSGHVTGAAIDVWSEEPPRSEVVRRLIQHPRMVVTPHLGANSEGDPELLARAVLAGLLGPVMAGPVNLVNARLVAAERGVEVRIERQPETTGYKSVVSIATETSDGRKITAGTVFDGQPRI